MSRTIVLLCVPASWHSRDGAALPAIECRVPARDFRSPWLIGSDCTHLSTESPIHRSADPATHRSIYPSTDLSPPRSEDAMFAAVCRLVRISRERRKGNFVRYEGGECDDRADWCISAAISGGSPPPKTALRSRSCRRPSDTECAAPFRLNCKKNVSVVFRIFAKFSFQKFLVPRKNLDFAGVLEYFQNFQNHSFRKNHVL